MAVKPALSRAALVQRQDYTATHAGFRWAIPEYFNIGRAICSDWAAVAPDQVAIVDVGLDGTARRMTYADLEKASNQLANHLQASGVVQGDVVAILLPQSIETAIAHIAALKLGAVTLPLFMLFGPEALEHRLTDAAAKVVVTHAEGAALIHNLSDVLPDLDILTIGGSDWESMRKHGTTTFETVRTRADDPAILIYTSGTTGAPKGALHAHRVLLAHLPGFETSLNFAPKPEDVIWTPADWAWIGGLLDVLMPALYHGIPVISHRFAKFSGPAALDLMKNHDVTLAFLPPTALKLMRLEADAKDWRLKLRAVSSGGEALSPDLIAWGQDVLGCEINELYGQTECNLVLMSCTAMEPVTPGMLGRPVAGFDVDIIDPETGVRLAEGIEGAIAVLAPNPVMFLRYLNRPEATQDKYIQGPDGQWLVMGDRGVRRADGLFQFVGRDDDVISSAGYRIGPSEVEACLIGHNAVALAGVVGMPDPIRGSIVAAYVTLKDGYVGSDALAADIAKHVKARLAAYEYPRVVRFLDALPMTTTGKIIRADLRALAEAEACGAQNERPQM